MQCFAIRPRPARVDFGGLSLIKTTDHLDDQRWGLLPALTQQQRRFEESQNIALLNGMPHDLRVQYAISEQIRHTSNLGHAIGVGRRICLWLWILDHLR